MLGNLRVLLTLKYVPKALLKQCTQRLLIHEALIPVKRYYFYLSISLQYCANEDSIYKSTLFKLRKAFSIIKTLKPEGRVE